LPASLPASIWPRCSIKVSIRWCLVVPITRY
jgi:hypothetical protein